MGLSESVPWFFTHAADRSISHRVSQNQSRVCVKSSWLGFGWRAGKRSLVLYTHWGYAAWFYILPLWSVLWRSSSLMFLLWSFCRWFAVICIIIDLFVFHFLGISPPCCFSLYDEHEYRYWSPFSWWDHLLDITWLETLHWVCISSALILCFRFLSIP